MGTKRVGKGGAKAPAKFERPGRPWVLLFLGAACCILLALPMAAQAALYRYTDEAGRQVITNDPASVPPALRKSLEKITLEQIRKEKEEARRAEERAQEKNSLDLSEKPQSVAPSPPDEGGASKEAPAPTPQHSAAAPEGSGGSIIGAVAGGVGRVVAGGAARWIVDPVSGLISLPESLRALESGTRPFLRMALLFLLAISSGLFLIALFRHLKKKDLAEWANNPILQMRGLIFGLSVFAGGFLAWFAWHAAQLDWKEQVNLLWESTAGALIQSAGASEEDARTLRVALSEEVVEVTGPQDLLQKYELLIQSFEQSLDAADHEIAFLGRLCTGKEDPGSPQELLSRLLHMDSGLKTAHLKENDVRLFRRAAARIGFDLGPDPVQKAQPRFAELQRDLDEAQGNCQKMSLTGLQQRDAALEQVPQ